MMLQHHTSKAAAGSRPSASRQQRTLTIARATSEAAPAQAQLPRRLALMGLSSLVLLPASQAQAAYKSVLCTFQDTEEERDVCRRQTLEKDIPAKDVSKEYAQGTDRNFTAVSGVPVAELDTEYVRASKALIAEIEQYCELDPYNKDRIALIKKLKPDALAWVSKYARGGSARSLSARRLYIAVDGVVGFLSSNGLAPYPKQKVKTTLATIEQAKEYLAEGK